VTGASDRSHEDQDQDLDQDLDLDESEARGFRRGNSSAGDSCLIDERLAAILDSFADHCRRGDHKSISEYIEKYPELAPRIRELFPALALLQAAPAESTEGRQLAAMVPEPRDSPAASGGARPLRLGEFHLLRELGRGGMGVVYEALQESLDRRVALKILAFHALMDPRRLERFRREARAAAQLQHPAIVPVYGMGVHEGIHFYAMKYIDGPSLDSVLPELRRLSSGSSAAASGRDVPVAAQEACAKPPSPSTGTTVALRLLGALPPAAPGAGDAQPGSASGPAPPLEPRQGAILLAQWTHHYYRNVARVGLEAAGALAHAHACGIHHRDIKPSNLMVDTEGKTWVVDFGLAKAASEEDITRSGELLGTLRYMAPEQLRGRADARSDIYSLGLTLYELLTLQPVFSGANQDEIAKQLECGVCPSPPRKLDPRIPRGLDAIVFKAIQKPPEDRYLSAKEMAADLERFLGGRRVRPTLPGPRRRLQSFLARRRRALAVAGALFLVASLLGVIALLAHRPRLGQYLFAADLDGDGRAELVMVGAGSNSITVLSNDGRGKFAVAGHYQVGDTPIAAAAADVDGDGHLDLAVANHRTRNVSVLRNRGDGSFGGASSYDLGGFLNWIAVGDLDGDGSPDLLAATTERKLCLLRNRGSGDFAEPEIIATASQPNILLLADLGSGHLDAITTHGLDGGTTLSILRNDGRAAFEPSAREEIEIGDGPWGLLAADLDADGDMDLAVAHPGGADITILLNLDGRGGSFEQSKLSVGSSLQTLCSGDFDADGHLDLAGAGGRPGLERVCVLPGRGGASFAPPTELPPCKTPSSVAALDLDGDGTLDLAVSGYSRCDVTLYYNDGKGGFVRPAALGLSPWWRPRFLSRE
jgi:serine/threonine protein kinase